MTLHLDDRALLHDAMRPPRGMEIGAAVGTTFTLDLTALLAIPVAASFGLDSTDDDDSRADLLETIRRYSDRTVLFCQAGAISVPPKYRNAFTYVEQTVVEVKKPPGGLFHPKVWVLRFEGGRRQLHRVLVLTRNLTFDNALDLIIRLDEDPDCERAANVSALVAALDSYPSAAARMPRPGQLDLVSDLTRTLSRARLAVPEPFTTGRLVAGTPGQRRRPFHPHCDHALAVSPFLSAEAARWFLPTADGWSGIVSRRGSLDAVAEELRDTTRVMRVRDALVSAQEAAETDLDDPALDSSEDAAADAVRGLHAKLYAQDTGATSTLWIGSANLTRAAFGLNYEMLIELTGPSRVVGIDTILDPRAERRDLSQLVEDHELPSAPERLDLDQLDASVELANLAFEVAGRKITLSLSEVGETWTAELAADLSDLPSEVKVFARPLSLRADFVRMTDGSAAWSGLDLLSITPFVVFELRQQDLIRRLLIKAELIGDPGGRQEQILARAITSREDFLRYLGALLGIPYGGAPPQQAKDPGLLNGFWPQPTLRSSRILEDLLTTASRASDRLESLQSTLAQLEARPDMRDIIPEDFRDVWDAVHRAIQPDRRRPVAGGRT